MSKYLVLVPLFVLFSILSFAQRDANLFEYENGQYEASVVKAGEMDSLKSFEKVVLKGLDSEIPFYHLRTKRNTGNKYVILIHGLGGNKFYWIYPSEPYLQYTKNLTSIQETFWVLGSIL